MRKVLVLFVAVFALFALAACGGGEGQTVVQTVVVTEIVEGETVEKVVEKVVTATPEPVDTGPKELIVCMAQEPDTLLYDVVGGTNALVKTAVLHALTDPVYTGLSYDYQPVLLEKRPSLEDGDAEFIDVEVTEGMMVYDPEQGDVVTYTGEPTTMQAMRVTFKWKEGITWEDGTPLTAYDSVMAYELGNRPDSGVPSRFTYDVTASYEATDDYTTVWTGVPGWVDSTYWLNAWGPVPRHELEGLTPDEIRNDEKFARSPLSFGGFSLRAEGAEWVAGDHITLVKNPNYWRASEGLPKVDRLIYKFIPDTNQLLAQLLAGQCDVGTQDGMGVDQAPFLINAEQEGLLKPYFVTGTVWEHIDFQLDPGDDRPALGRCAPVRLAMVLATDRQTMVDEVLFGRSKVLNVWLPEEHPMYAADSVNTYPFDPERAAQILEESGWVDNDGDGIREANGVSCEWVNWRTKEVETYQVPDGTPLKFVLNTTSGNKMREQVTQIFQQNMKDIGIDIELEYLPAGVYFGDPPDGPLFSRKYDLAEFAWLTGVEPPGDLYTCDGVPDESNGWAGLNNTAYCNPEYDQAVRAAQSTLIREEQAANWAKAQEIFTREDQLPIIPLFQRLKVAATRPEVVGFNMDPTENSELYNVEEWDIVSQQ
nr:peptide ABC transporter substrate-binding protein [Ardenticatena sp.]